MKVNRKTNLLKLSEVAIGDCFIFTNEIQMRLIDSCEISNDYCRTNEIPTVNLETGKVSLLRPITDVTPIDACMEYKEAL